LGINDKCRFLGFVDREKVRDCLAASDIFLFPSKTETQGLAMAEALAMGVPVIAADSFGARETVRDGLDGFILSDGPDAFANAVEELLKNREKLNKMKEEAVKGAKRFSAEESARKLLALYERVIENKVK
jgi:glycosyltransferase involved in cell wall biosynthesis